MLGINLVYSNTYNYTLSFVYWLLCDYVYLFFTFQLFPLNFGHTKIS